ncbi:sensor histidine kinase [Tenacibaculum maritimum]|uniref:sensor histidine kinase n=10 Tax=Tenacibaculum maritimum TaxID=107401 RepID=UPI000426AE99|nr:sensor histidine kinase [Tenacibaculum maritimum]MCD9580468.1 ATP-binding protein [Tenacibaculum maritimum]MCD9634898.1 ATP-binding protein [Tenacibaculum maritimum]CAA0180550.1 Signal transduction histidine kinase [Tenacibaculum maritimum]CAA0252655.1 Signal transduction histidine kinase [Tenacibaculum maritimum]
MANNRKDSITFNFDVSAYRLLGRELITDRITALFELVKNAYDANAENVSVEFQNINPLSTDSKIIIKDDGIGMQFSDIKNKWMVIGTSSKRRERLSPPPYRRKVSGKKGVGRFAVDKLGEKLILKTKKKEDKQLLCLETDWSHYSGLEDSQFKLNFEDEKPFFTDVENSYWYEDSIENNQGTTLEISLVSEIWTKDDINRAYKELSKLVSPNTDVKKTYPFNITIKAPYEGFENKIVKTQLIDFATKKIQLSYNTDKDTQEILQYNKVEKDLSIINVPKRPCGLLKLTLYYFNQEDKRKYKSHFKSDIDGIKIYRDGIITTPFAEYVSNQEKQKDILGIDKRRYSGFFERFGSRDLLGYIEITDENNPNIIESTNRQGFVDNEAWEELRKFIIEQIVQIETYYKNVRKSERGSTKSSLGGANKDLKNIKKEIASIKKEASPQVKEKLKSIEANLGKIQGSVTKSIKDYANLEKESKQKENLFFSLVSLQTYAAMFSHMTKHTIGHILTSAEYFSNNYPNPKLENRFIKISKNIYNEMLKLRKGVDFMLKYAKSDTELEEINLKDLVADLFNDIYYDRFFEENINTEIAINEKLILNYNRKSIEDIFDNLISNSIKALKGIDDKRIKCSSITTKNDLTILFSDNGIGIKEEDRFRIFDIFFTKTSEDGGAGMGLYMVKTRVEAMQGDIEVVENEFKPNGATLKITLPFKK